MKKRILIALVVVLALAASASLVWAGGEGTFGGYVRTLARAGIPDVLDVLGLDFGALFVSPVTGNAPEIIDVDDDCTTVQEWVVTEDLEHAVQWFTWNCDSQFGLGKELPRDIIAVWSKEPVSELQTTCIDFTEPAWFPHYPILGHYCAAYFDVTD